VTRHLRVVLPGCSLLRTRKQLVRERTSHTLRRRARRHGTMDGRRETKSGRPHFGEGQSRVDVLAGMRAELGLRPMAEFNPDVPSRVYDRLNEEFFDWEPEKYAVNYRQWARSVRGTDEMEWDGLLLLGWRPL